MIKLKNLFVMGLVAVSAMLQSCNDDDDDRNWQLAYPNALVTVKTNADNSTFLQLDEKTTLFPENIKSQIYKGKEVRALVNYEVIDKNTQGYDKTVHVNWIDSIRTKNMLNAETIKNISKLGNDPVEIVNDWVTIAEDGYLTLRVRTVWGNTGRVHYLNLVGGTNPENPFEVELRHDANGDVYGQYADALIAFRLSELPKDIPAGQKLTLKWRSFNGTTKKTDFNLNSSSIVPRGNVDDVKSFSAKAKYIK